MTALASVAALLISVIAAAVPHWGSYSRHHIGLTSGFIGGSFSDPHNQGNFGPFQICYDYGISVCGGGAPFKTREFIKVAGACSLLVVFSLSGLAFFSVLHVAMQLQRREHIVSFQRAVFLKVVFSSVAALGSVLACIFGGIEFEVLGREARYSITIGVCFYLQIILIFVNTLFIIVCYISLKKAKRHPPAMVPKSRIPGYNHSSPQRRTSSHKIKENITRHDYDVPHKSSSFDYGMMPLHKSETPQNSRSIPGSPSE
jgi:hypothetical protein